jgi:GT2 family glycosyltransferase
MTAAGAEAHPTVSVVIASWNARDDLERCLQSLVSHTSTATLELVIVDNGSADDSVAMIKAAWPEATLVENEGNLGFARACNQGMRVSTGEFILLLNSDTYVQDNVIGRCAHELRGRPDVGMLGCELRFPGGRRQHTANRSLSVTRSLVRNLWLYRLLPRSRRGQLLLGGYWEDDSDIEVDWLAGAFLMLRRDVFDRSGGFDERFHMYGEDSEWGMRLRRMGVKILYAPRLGVVYHTGAVGSDQRWTEKERLRRCHRGGLESYAFTKGRPRAQLYRVAELVGSALRWGVYRAALAVRPNEYLAQQAAMYRWLVEFYLVPGRPDR